MTVSRENIVRLWDVFASTGELVERAKSDVPRCLTQSQLKDYYLPVEPPRWCITGAGLESETDPAKWQPKWPYDQQAWRDWLVAQDRQP